MKKQSLLLKINLVFFLCCAGIYQAQETTLAAGGTFHSTAGSLSYSVGQIFYEPQKTATGEVNPGVQQPYEIYVLATNNTSSDKNITVYPNPVKDFLIVDFNAEKLENSSYQLFDGTGRIISKGELKNLKTEINTSTLSSGLYMLSISNGGKNIKTFKIIKNK